MGEIGHQELAGEPARPAWRVRAADRLRQLRGPILAVAAVGTVLGGLAGYWNSYRAVRQAVGPAAAQTPGVAAPSVTASASGDRRMSFAVLPFSAPDEDSIALDLARRAKTYLEHSQASRFKWATVAPAATVEQAMAMGTTPRALGVRYLLQGIVNPVPGGHRLQLTLMNAGSERVLSTRTLRLNPGRTGAVNPAEAEEALGRLTYEALRVEVEAARAKPDADLDVRDLAFRAHVDWAHAPNGQVPADNYRRVRALIDRALAMAPDDALALQVSAHVHLFCECSGDGVPAPAERERLAVEAIDRSLRHRPDSTHMLVLRSYVFHRNNRHEEALHAVEDALTFDPEHADALAMRAGILFELKRYDEAQGAVAPMLGAIEDAQRHALAAAIHFARQDDAAAVLHARKSVSQLDHALAADPQFGSVRLTLVAALARAGRIDEARQTLADLKAAVPQVGTIAAVKTWLTGTSPVMRDEALYSQLRRAGMPE
jgi:tetratricopeptide (TPR) repeat protein